MLGFGSLFALIMWGLAWEACQPLFTTAQFLEEFPEDLSGATTTLALGVGLEGDDVLGRGDEGREIGQEPVKLRCSGGLTAKVWSPAIW